MTQSALQSPSRARPNWDWNLWRRWVAANAIAETIGLGGSALVVVAMMTLIDADTVGGMLLTASVSVLLGAFFEGVLVGAIQWRILRGVFENLTQRAWVVVTAGGACAAWLLGFLPSTLMTLLTTDTAPSPQAATPVEPPAALIYTMAAAMGLVLGVVLGGAQWIELRRYVPRAGLWIIANALAWLVGMPLVFVAAANVPAGPITVWTVLLIVGVVLAAGAAVGAMHGLALLVLTRSGAHGDA